MTLLEFSFLTCDAPPSLLVQFRLAFPLLVAKMAPRTTILPFCQLQWKDGGWNCPWCQSHGFCLGRTLQPEPSTDSSLGRISYLTDLSPTQAEVGSHFSTGCGNQMCCCQAMQQAEHRNQCLYSFPFQKLKTPRLWRNHTDDLFLSLILCMSRTKRLSDLPNDIELVSDRPRVKTHFLCSGSLIFPLFKSDSFERVTSHNLTCDKADQQFISLPSAMDLEKSSLSLLQLITQAGQHGTGMQSYENPDALLELSPTTYMAFSLLFLQICDLNLPWEKFIICSSEHKLKNVFLLKSANLVKKNQEIE